MSLFTWMAAGTFDYNSIPTQTYELEPMSQTLLVKTSTNSYELQYPDGARREFTANPTAPPGSTRRIFLTQVIDPYGPHRAAQL
jgi:hypothetical protein